MIRRRGIRNAQYKTHGTYIENNQRVGVIAGSLVYVTSLLVKLQDKNKEALTQFLSIVDILPFSTSAAHEYGKIRADLQRKGSLIGPLDMLIASHAKSAGLIIVTNNVREFGRIDGLVVEDWTM